MSLGYVILSKVVPCPLPSCFNFVYFCISFFMEPGTSKEGSNFPTLREENCNSWIAIQLINSRRWLELQELEKCGVSGHKIICQYQPSAPCYGHMSRTRHETGRKGAGHNLWKNDIAQGHDINWLEPNGSKIVDKSTSSRPWGASVYAHCNTSAS